MKITPIKPITPSSNLSNKHPYNRKNQEELIYRLQKAKKRLKDAKKDDITEEKGKYIDRYI